MGKFMHTLKNGRHHIIMVGSILIILQTIGLGYLELVHNKNAFLVISFVAQLLGGFGAGMNSTASMAMISSFSGQKRERYVGYMEASAGIGLLFGPLLGAGAYGVGGYCAPFLFFGKSYF